MLFNVQYRKKLGKYVLRGTAHGKELDMILDGPEAVVQIGNIIRHDIASRQVQAYMHKKRKEDAAR